MPSVNLQNIYKQIPVDFGQFLTLRGVEYEFTWIDEAVAAAGKIYIQITLSTTKYTLVNFREVQMDQERGFFRFYTDFSGGVEGDAVPLISMRGDTSVPSDTSIVRLTGPTINPASEVVEVPMFGVAGQGNQPAQGELASGTSVRVIPPGSRALLEFENNSVASAYMRGNFKQWEISPNAIPETGEI